jgi:hypothetical protein
MKWTVDVDFKPSSVANATGRITTLATQAAWTHLGVSKYADGTLNVDTDWEFATLQEAFAKVQALSTIEGFMSATLKYSTGELGEAPE